LGVPLFQEQLLKMAMVTAGFSATEAEELRRAFGFKRSERLMAEVETKLRAGMARQGIHGAAAEEIVHAITAFALYGFPESHASVEAREARPFGSIHDLARRAHLDCDELETLAAIGALAPLGGTRRTNLWTAAMPHPGPLFADPPPEPSPLSEMTDIERLAAD